MTKLDSDGRMRASDNQSLHFLDYLRNEVTLSRISIEQDIKVLENNREEYLKEKNGNQNNDDEDAISEDDEDEQEEESVITFDSERVGASKINGKVATPYLRVKMDQAIAEMESDVSSHFAVLGNFHQQQKDDEEEACLRPSAGKMTFVELLAKEWSSKHNITQ